MIHPCTPRRRKERSLQNPQLRNRDRGCPTKQTSCPSSRRSRRRTRASPSGCSR
ncbi:piriformospora indica-insensitive protein 2-like [Iris pallida]|uniref:Piriformospora indica-insensitive protein 2-like n=1 Tax=Iris pallida TaxID=29817 RepID=A0AAX6HWZ2_IRIPA|nr:piriformospora indica-insensitive protein 2-like [Iris pallida]